MQSNLLNKAIADMLLKSQTQTIFFSLLIYLLSSSLVSAQQIQLIALFEDKAMIKVDGKRVLLHKNKKNRYNILLLSANPERAVIRHDGKDVSYQLNMLIATSYTKKQQVEVILWANNQNMFSSNGKINGKNVNFLVDTGATAIAMSENQAKRLAINYKGSHSGFAQTASEVVKSWHVRLNSVELGEIKLRNVDAIVLQGNQMRHILLGMTFLSQVKMTRNGQKMHLIKKY